ncbi:hypothetical protein USDA257_c46440 [Sinorhizobium fredii USDA 257]|uniref:Uncharacterized protein n=1 Tax=Sinorhizobium fredii (strain USDA 257) TaxID=1185652 RepID=I3XBC5_SINF2|nr:hypothetical protein USDA257_c46440 [Sinorhizobium fredii USDA 257]
MQGSSSAASAARITLETRAFHLNNAVRMCCMSKVVMLFV